MLGPVVPALSIRDDARVTISGDDARLAVQDVRTFVPAREFARSRVFYEALGWTTTWTDEEGLALLELGGYRFMLQNHYVQDWAENFMLTIVVNDARPGTSESRARWTPATSVTPESRSRRTKRGARP